MKIIIYGISRETLCIADAIKKEHEIVGISDGYAEISWYGQYRFYQAS